MGWLCILSKVYAFNVAERLPRNDGCDGSIEPVHSRHELVELVREFVSVHSLDAEST